MSEEPRELIVSHLQEAKRLFKQHGKCSIPDQNLFNQQVDSMVHIVKNRWVNEPNESKENSVVWSAVLDIVGGLLERELRKAKGYCDKSGFFVLEFPKENQPAFDYCKDQSRINRVEAAFLELFGKKIHVVCVILK